MGPIMQFGLALGLAGSAGVRAYFPLIVIGLLARFSESISVKPPVTIIASLPLLLLLTILAAFELMPELFAGVHESLLIMPFVRGLAGAILFSGVFSGFGIFFGFIFGGMAAVLAFLITGRIKGTYRHNTENRRNARTASAIEEVAAITGTLLAVLLPWSWYIIWGLALFYILKRTRENQNRFRSQVKPKSWR